jgi:hypothetical protein
MTRVDSCWSRDARCLVASEPLFLERLDRFGEELEGLPEGVVAPVPQQPAGPLLQGLDRPPALRGGPPAVGRQAYELGSGVGRVGHPADVAAGFQVIDHRHHGLLRETGLLGQVGEPRPRPAIDRQEQRGVARAEVGIPAFSQVSVQFGRQGTPRLEQETGDVGHPGIFAGGPGMVNNIDHPCADPDRKR